MPIELTIAGEVHKWPEVRKIREFVAREAGNFKGAPLAGSKRAGFVLDADSGAARR